jgi:hypothetical protein
MCHNIYAQLKNLGYNVVDNLHLYEIAQNMGMDGDAKQLKELLNAPKSTPAPSNSGDKSKDEVYPNFKQNNPLWANLTIGNTSIKIKDKGCVICSLANLLNHFNFNVNPATLAKQLKFANTGDVYWSSITTSYPKVIFIDRIDYSKVQANISLIDGLLSHNFPVLVETRTGLLRRNPHWVILWEKEYDKYVMSDPLSDEVFFENKYKDPARWIYKIVYYKFNP